jgi:phage-related protein
MESRKRRPLVWLHGKIKTPPFSPAARIEAGILLRRLQDGETLGLPHSRPMSNVGPGCHELRILDNGRCWRIIYHLASDGVVILEIFAKKSRKTPTKTLRTCRRRLQVYLGGGG